MAVKVVLHDRKIRELIGSIDKSLTLTADELLSTVKKAEVMPYKTGDMQNTTYVKHSKNTSYIISKAKYSGILYSSSYNFSKRYNKYARAMWYEPWITNSDKKRALKNELGDFIKTESRGIVK